MPILDQVHLVESLAYHDASTAWVAMICSDSGHYAGRVDDAAARELYPSMDLLTAGQIYPVGQAMRVDGGYRVSGPVAVRIGEPARRPHRRRLPRASSTVRRS